jgi:hypothetical protein
MLAAHLPGTLEMLAGVCPPGAGRGRPMVNTRGFARLGVLAVGLGIGAAWAHTPVAAADSSSDWLSSIDGLLSGALPAADPSGLNLTISFDGMSIVQDGNATGYHRFRRIRPGDRLRRRRQRYSRGRDRTTATGPSRAPKLWAATVTAQATSAISPSPMARMAILPTRALATTTSPLSSATTATRPPAADLTPLWSATTTSPPSSTPSAPWAALPSPAKASTSPVVSISLPSSATALTRSRRLLAATSWSRSCRCCSRALRNKARGKRLPDW